MHDLKSFIEGSAVSQDSKQFLLNGVHEITNLMTCFEKAYQVYKTTWSAITTFDPLLLKENLITQADDDYQISVYESLWKLFAAFIYSECSKQHHQPDKFLAILIQLLCFMSSYISSTIWRPPRECTFFELFTKNMLIHLLTKYSVEMSVIKSAHQTTLKPLMNKVGHHLFTILKAKSTIIV